MGYWEIEFLAYYGMYYLPGADRDGCSNLKGTITVLDAEDIRDAIVRAEKRAATFGFDKVLILSANWVERVKEEVTK